MKQERLNHLMMLYIHKDRKIDMNQAVKEFILCNEDRKFVFGKPYSDMVATHAKYHVCSIW